MKFTVIGPSTIKATNKDVEMAKILFLSPIVTERVEEILWKIMIKTP